MMDRNDIDLALHGIQQMITVAVNAQEGLLGSETPGVHEMSAADSELLSFAVFDLQKRVEALRAAIWAPVAKCA